MPGSRGLRAAGEAAGHFLRKRVRGPAWRKRSNGESNERKTEKIPGSAFPDRLVRRAAYRRRVACRPLPDSARGGMRNGRADAVSARTRRYRPVWSRSRRRERRIPPRALSAVRPPPDGGGFSANGPLRDVSRRRERDRQFSVQHILADFFQDTGLPRPGAGSGRHGAARGGVADCRESRGQGLRYTERLSAGVLRYRILVYRRRGRVQSAPQGQERRGPARA